MLKRRIIIGLIGIFLILVCYAIIPKMVYAEPDNTTIYVSVDAFIRSSVPDDNFGDNTALAVWTLINGNYRSFLKFDLSGLEVGAVISLAKLRVNCYNVIALSSPDSDVQARRVSDDSWTELGITWTNQKDHDIIEDTQIPSVGWVEWDITDFVQNEWASDEMVSVLLKSVTEDFDGTSRYSLYRAREYNGGSVKPELYIEYSMVSDDEPFYSNAGSDSVTQVGESADFWVFWEDDFALNTCYFSTNNTGSWVNSSISVSGVSSWANMTLPYLNYTSSIQVEYMWYCSDNASQWNWTSTYSLITTSLYITFNFNNSTMGKFYVDYVNTANETQNSYDYNKSILLDGIQLSSDYSFLNFTWISGNSLSNNYDYYTLGNNTIWCYFGLSGVGGIDESYFVLGFVITGCAILFIVIVLKSDKKEK